MSASLEHYLECIYRLHQHTQKVRVKDVAELAEVKAPSVLEALGHLKTAGLIDHQRYGAITLTAQGQRRARAVYRRHEMLCIFFRDIMQVEESIAEQDACTIEHYLSKETVDKMVAFIEQYPGVELSFSDERCTQEERKK